MSGDAPARFPSLTLESPYVILRTIREEDLEPLRIASVEVLGPGWRTRGLTPSPAAFASSVWSSDVQFLGLDRATGAAISWLSLYNFEPLDGVAYCATARLTEQDLGRRFLSSIMVFLDYCFRALSLRKIFFEVAEFNMPALAGLVGDPMREEARITQRFVADGITWDLLVFSLTRAELEKWRLFESLTQGTAPPDARRPGPAAAVRRGR